MPDTVGQAAIEIEPTSSERFARLLKNEISRNLDSIADKVTGIDRKLGQAAQSARDLSLELSKIKVQPKVDTSLIDREFDRIRNEKFTLPFDIDEADVRRQLDRIKFSPHFEEQFAGKFKDVRVDVHANIAPAMAEMAELSGRNIRVDIEGNVAPAIAAVSELSGQNVRVDVESNVAPAIAAMGSLDKKGAESAHKFSALWTAAGVAAAYGVARIASQVGQVGLQTASMFEQANISFTNFLGPAADDFIKKLKDFAASTPFEFSQLQGAASQLLAVGREANEVIPLMTALGDSTSAIGTGAEGIKSAVRALTQMQQKGKVTGEEMLQLAEAGVPAWDALATKLGVSVVDAQEMVSKGQVKVNDLFAALEGKAGKSLQRVSGMMDEQSKSLSGLWSTLKDTIGQGLADLFGPIIPVIKDTLPALAKSLQPVFEVIGKSLAPFAKTLSETFTALAPAFAWLAGSLGVILDSGLKALAPILITLAPIAAKLAVIIATTLSKVFEDLGPVIELIVADLAPLLPMLFELGSKVIAMLVPVLVSLLKAFEPLVPILVAGIGYALLAIQPVLPIIVDAFSHLGLALIEVLKAVVPILPPLLRLFSKLMQSGVVEGITLAIGAFADVLVMLAPLLQSYEEFIGSFYDALASGDWSAFTKRLQDMWNFVTTWITGTAIPWLQKMIPQWWEAFVGWIQESAPIALGYLGQWLAALGGWIVGTALPWLVSKAGELGSAFGGWLVDQASQMPARLGGLVDIIEAWLTGTAIPFLTEKAGELSSALISWLTDQASQMPERLGNLISIIGTWLTGTAIPFLFRKAGELTGTFMRWLVDTARETPSRLLDLLHGIGDWFVNDAIPTIKRKGGEMLSSFMSWLVDAVKQLPGKLSEFATSLFNWLQGLPGQIVSAIGNAGSWLFNLGKDVLNGLLSGITDAAKAIGNFVGGLKDQFVDGFKSAFGISSPSKVMMGIGDQIAAGLAAGVAGGIPKLDDAAAKANKSLGKIGPGSFGFGGVGLAANGPLGALPPIGSSAVVSPITIGAIHITVQLGSGTPPPPEDYGPRLGAAVVHGIREIVGSA